MHTYTHAYIYTYIYRFAWSRIPLNLQGQQREIHSEAHGVIHFGYIHWEAALDRIRLTRVLLREKYPNASVQTIASVQGEVVHEAGVVGVMFQGMCVIVCVCVCVCVRVCECV